MRKSRISILATLTATLSIITAIPANAESEALNPPISWRLIDESAFPEGLPEGFEPMKVPEGLVSESISENTTNSVNLERAFICSPHAHAENPHTSGSDVSAHGFWKKNNCSNSRAKVRVDLAAFWGNRRTGVGSWITITSNTREIRSGGGRGQRVTARAYCHKSAHPVSWRNLVDVDVIGERDWPGRQENIKTLHCQPRG